MSSASTVTYTSVYTDFEPGRVFWGADEELSNGGSPRVIVYGYDGLLMQPIAQPFPDYVPGPEYPPSPDYVPSPEHLPSPVEVPYVPEPEYPECLVPSDAEAPLEDQPLPTDASPTSLLPGYVADSDPDEDPEEDPEEDHTDGGDGDDEPLYDDDDDDDTDDEDEEPFEDEDDDEEEEEHLAPTDSSAVPAVDPVPFARDTEAFETDESAPTTKFCPSPRRHNGRLSDLSHLSSLSIPPPVDRKEDIPKVELPPRKRLCLTSPISRYEVRESSTTSPRPTGRHRADYGFIGTMDAEIRCQRAREVGYGIRDVWVDPTEAVEEVAPTTLKGVNARVTELAARVDVLTEDRQFHHETALLFDQKALVSLEAWAYSVGLSLAIHYELQVYRTHTQIQDYRIASQESLTATLIAQISSLHGQLSAALG
ncbi:hypothetical protein Tco_1258433 [Tanacetum coccineum]